MGRNESILEEASKISLPRKRIGFHLVESRITFLILVKTKEIHTTCAISYTLSRLTWLTGLVVKFRSRIFKYLAKRELSSLL